MSKQERSEPLTPSRTKFSVIRRWLRVNASTPGRRRQIVLTAVAVVAAITGFAVWVLWPDPRQREYVDAKACLLTDEKGILGEPAKTVWSSMKDASVETLVRVQYLQVTGPQTVANAETYLNTLTLSHCGMIVAAGQAQIDSVNRHAGENLDIQFVTVDGGTGATNVRALNESAPETLRKELQNRLEDLADAAS
ncbi:type 1 periplasmic-binding domain-containing protein [Paractinoplanes durhamensis]|uniref:hypothetical protein n=1 Tax=Paractinoplanes durhamensis TaxID=113563 RepID=UPI0036413688